MGVLLGLATALSWGTGDYLAALASRRSSALAGLIGVDLASLGFVGAWILGTGGGENLQLQQGLALAAIGLVGALGSFCFLQAMVIAPVSIVSAMVSSYSVVILIWALAVLGEALVAEQVLGAILTFTGMLFICVRVTDVRSAGRVVPGTVLSLCATVTLGSWIFGIEFYGRSVGVLLALLIGRLSATAVLITVAAARTRALHVPRPPSVAILVAAGLVDTLGYVLFELGARHEQTAVVAVASSVYFLVPVALATWLLRERPAGNQWLGFAVVVVGLVLLALAG
jgi:drug/metabolite transporter (DMT)-like permease